MPLSQCMDGTRLLKDRLIKMPSGTICNVSTCKNNAKTAKENGEILYLFSFPKAPKIQKQWSRKCYRKGVWHVANKRICSKHFKPEDFEDMLRARIMNTQPTHLTKSAVLSLYLLNGQEKYNESERSKRTMHKNRKAIVGRLISRNEEPLLKITEPADEIKRQEETLSERNRV